MSFATKSLATGAALAAIAGAAVFLANAQDSRVPIQNRTPPATVPAIPTGKNSLGPAAQGLAAAEATNPQNWIGLTVIASDGSPVGQVVQVKPAVNAQAPDLVVRNPSDAKTMTVPGNLAALNGKAVQLKATADELGRMVN